MCAAGVRWAGVSAGVSEECRVSAVLGSSSDGVAPAPPQYTAIFCRQGSDIFLTVNSNIDTVFEMSADGRTYSCS